MFYNKNYGDIIVFSGPSGVGKTTICKAILEKLGSNSSFSVSCTTRKRRFYEIEGIHYYFVNKKYFKENIKNGNFIEYVIRECGNYYGTLKQEVINKLDNGINVIFEIDIAGVFYIKKFFERYNNKYNIKTIFLLPPNFSELKKRLVLRKSETEENIIQRLDISNKELKQFLLNRDLYNHVVVNFNFNETVKIILEKISASTK